MWGFLDVKKFNLGKILLRFYSIEAFSKDTRKILYNKSQSKYRE
ncbi:hypothetical protein J540_3646 [Acinetobacter baumannii 1440422]|nr:hypothetical protein J540_3646 [Acinetobacter baumannii 1440422]